MIASRTPLLAFVLAASAHAQALPEGLPQVVEVPALDTLVERTLDPDASFETRHASCLRAIALDPEAAYEVGLTWQGRGGGFRADHCTAMALFALGHEEEAAERLEALAADFPDTDPKYRRLKTDYLSEAAQSWLQAGEADRAWEASSAALDLEPSDAGARITRARIYFALDRFEDAETDLTSLLAFHPEHAQGLRYRADARLKLGKLDAAMQDAEDSLALAPDVDTALIRGHIREALAKTE